MFGARVAQRSNQPSANTVGGRRRSAAKGGAGGAPDPPEKKEEVEKESEKSGSSPHPRGPAEDETTEVTEIAVTVSSPSRDEEKKSRKVSGHRDVITSHNKCPCSGTCRAFRARSCRLSNYFV